MVKERGGGGRLHNSSSSSRICWRVGLWFFRRPARDQRETRALPAPLHELPPWQLRGSSSRHDCYYSCVISLIQLPPQREHSPTSNYAQTRSAAVSYRLFVCVFDSLWLLFADASIRSAWCPLAGNCVSSLTCCESILLSVLCAAPWPRGAGRHDSGPRSRLAGPWTLPCSTVVVGLAEC